MTVRRDRCKPIITEWRLLRTIQRIAQWILSDLKPLVDLAREPQPRVGAWKPSTDRRVINPVVAARLHADCRNQIWHRRVVVTQEVVFVEALQRAFSLGRGRVLKENEDRAARQIREGCGVRSDRRPSGSQTGARFRGLPLGVIADLAVEAVSSRLRLDNVPRA